MPALHKRRNYYAGNRIFAAAFKGHVFKHNRVFNYFSGILHPANKSKTLTFVPV